MTKQTHFGFTQVDEDQKAGMVAKVFNTVAENYDLMNDLMSLGIHRIWKSFAINQASVREGFRILDIAGGTGDMAEAFVKRAGKTGEVWLTDINEAMVRRGRDRLLDKGFILPVAVCDAEKLPFPDNWFERVMVSFGLRNMTHKDKALSEMLRVLKHGGKALILEFSRIWAPLASVYDLYSFNVLPWLGKHVANSEESYRYLAESIRMHPDQETLKDMMNDAGFVLTRYHNLSAGIVALHTGMKPYSI